MKKITSLLLTGMLVLSLKSFAAPNADVFPAKNPLHEEISKILSNSSLVVEKDFTLKVFFTVSQDKTIEIRSISPPRPEVNEYFVIKLQGRQLQGSKWIPNKVYELPVRVMAIK